jgi:glycine dehydrogenase subunit 1
VGFPYVPRGDGEEEAMLAAIGVPSFEALLAPVPQKLRLREPLNLPGPKSEFEVARRLGAMAGKNGHAERRRVFLGAGIYDHIVPAAVDHVAFRSEFYTAYTPYQPEVAQGTLTAAFEFQTMMAELTGMDLTNASLYDGATALGEAALLAVSVTGRKRLVVAGPLHPHYLQVLRTFCSGQGIEIVADPAPEGTVDRSWVRDHLAGEPAAVIAQAPNFFGIVEDLSGLFAEARDAGARAIQVFEPHALAIYETPGTMGADLAVGEGISLGTPPSFGGPALGLFTARQEFVRHVPGRLIGETVDRDGKRAYVMTLQTREQHIRRERATSNICTNQGLLALRAVIYLSLMGPAGMRETAEQCLDRAHYAAERLDALDGFRLRYRAPFFHEFVLECPRPAREIVSRCLTRGVVPGVNLGRFADLGPEGADRLLLVCVTEKHAREDLDALVEAVKEAGRG